MKQFFFSSFTILFCFTMSFAPISYTKSNPSKAKPSKKEEKQRIHRKRAGLGNSCSNETNSYPCSPELKTRIQDFVSAQIKSVDESNPSVGEAQKIDDYSTPSWQETRLTRYADFFNNRKTASGDCFSQNDPTLAVNQGSEHYLQSLVALKNAQGQVYFGYVTDTGRMAAKGNGDLDASTSLYEILGSNDYIYWVNLGSESLADDSDHEIISCLKEINQTPIQTNPIAKAEPLPSNSAPNSMNTEIYNSNTTHLTDAQSVSETPFLKLALPSLSIKNFKNNSSYNDSKSKAMNVNNSARLDNNPQPITEIKVMFPGRVSI